MTAPLETLHRTIEAALLDSAVDHHSPAPGSFFVKLPGTHKLFTNVWLVAGAHSLLVEAFVCRKPDENHEEFQRFLLRKNARMYAVAFSMDKAGDVYLVGRLPLHAVTPEEVDRVLGAVEHASAFSWHATAEGLLTTYRSALGDRARQAAVS